MRRAYGPHRAMSPATKAAQVARSILVHGYDMNDPATWIRYGLEAYPGQQQRVREAIAREWAFTPKAPTSTQDAA